MILLSKRVHLLFVDYAILCFLSFHPEIVTIFLHHIAFVNANCLTRCLMRGEERRGEESRSRRGEQSRQRREEESRQRRGEKRRDEKRKGGGWWLGDRGSTRRRKNGGMRDRDTCVDVVQPWPVQRLRSLLARRVGDDCGEAAEWSTGTVVDGGWGIEGVRGGEKMGREEESK